VAPEVVLYNYGSATLDSVTIEYRLGQGPISSFAWTGSLPTGASITVTLPGFAAVHGNYPFVAWTEDPNGVSDQNLLNDSANAQYMIGYEALTMEFYTGCQPLQNYWELTDTMGNVLAFGSNFTAQMQLYVQTICVANGCYDLKFYEFANNGICCDDDPDPLVCDELGTFTLKRPNGDTLAYRSNTTNIAFFLDSTRFCITSAVSPYSAQAVATDISCNGLSDGAATVSVQGGNPPYVILWSNGSTSATIIGLAAGTYTVTITDDSLNTTAASCQVVEPAVLNVVYSGTNSNCAGSSNGTATAAASGGTAPYSYLWSNGATTSALSGLGAGTFSATVTDSRGCISIGSVNLTEPPPLALLISATDVTCSGFANGTAGVMVSGGISPYNYLWSNGATTASLSNLVSGVYSVTVTDAGGCTINGQETVAAGVQVNVAFSVDSVSCHGLSDGAATVSVTGGSGPYQHLWSNGATTNQISGVAAGAY
jgi:hypothetical protein